MSTMKQDPVWLDEFADGFLSLARRFGIKLLATETCRGPLSFTVEVAGLVPRNQALRRDTARPGDLVFVTGTLGDAGAALMAIQGRLSLQDHVLTELSARLNRPEPRIREGLALQPLASSAIDISDGLAADLGHVLRRSGAGAHLEVDRLPLSRSMLNGLDTEQAWRAALSSGDDYELCFTLPPDREEALRQTWQSMSCPVTAIGRVMEQPGLSCRRRDGTEFVIEHGYEHFT